MSRKQDGEQGQAIAFVVLSLVALLGFGAVATDLGVAWYAKRQLQASVDAAALAGAQDLPSLSSAEATANDYVVKNRAAVVRSLQTTVSTRCTNAAPACSPANAVVVNQRGQVPTTFARVLGLSSISVSASATACQPCGTAPFDIVVALDRTGSMCSPQGPGGACTDLNNAKDGIKTLLRLMEPDIDQVGLVAFPPVRETDTACSTPWPSASQSATAGDAWYDDPFRQYVADPLLDDYKDESTGQLSTRSTLLQHLVLGDASACLRNNGTTSYSWALKQAKAELDRHGRDGVPKVIIFMTDGEANIGPVWDCASVPANRRAGCVDQPMNGAENMQPCHSAINTATGIKADDVTIYTIGYDLNDAGTHCLRGRQAYDSSQRRYLHKAGRAGVEEESPLITAISTLQSIASPGNFYNKPDAGQVNTIFAAIAADLTRGTSRLVDETY